MMRTYAAEYHDMASICVHIQQNCDPLHQEWVTVRVQVTWCPTLGNHLAGLQCLVVRKEKSSVWL